MRSHVLKFAGKKVLVYSHHYRPSSIDPGVAAEASSRLMAAQRHCLHRLTTIIHLREDHAGLQMAGVESESHIGRRRRVLMSCLGYVCFVKMR